MLRRDQDKRLPEVYLEAGSYACRHCRIGFGDLRLSFAPFVAFGLSPLDLLPHQPSGDIYSERNDNRIEKESQ